MATDILPSSIYFHFIFPISFIGQAILPRDTSGSHSSLFSPRPFDGSGNRANGVSPSGIPLVTYDYRFFFFVKLIRINTQFSSGTLFVPEWVGSRFVLNRHLILQFPEMDLHCWTCRCLAPLRRHLL